MLEALLEQARRGPRTLGEVALQFFGRFSFR
jgi:hypothetical protein